MFLLKLNKWTLAFDKKDFEDEFNEYQRPFQYKFNQLLLGFGMVVSLICLITFVAEQETTFILAQMGGTSALIFLEIIIIKKAFPFIKYIYAFNYLCIFIFVCYYLKYEDTNVPLFLSGHSYCLVLLCALQFCDKIIRLIYLISTPIIMLILSKGVNISNLYNLGQLMHGTFGIGMLFYWFEYTQRKAFSFHKQIEKTKEVLDEYTNDGLFAISLNDRTQQFQLEYHNKVISKMFQFVFDTNIMKEFIRNSYLVNDDEPLNKRDVFSLEDYLFKKLKSKLIQQSPNVREFKLIENKQTIKPQFFTVTIKLFDFDQQYLFITIKFNKSNEIQEQYNQQIKSLNNVILAQSFEMQKITSIFQKRFQVLQKEQLSRSQLISLKCLNLKLRNLLNNNFVYFQMDKNINLNYQLINFKFNEYMNQIHRFFLNQSKVNYRLFRLLNEINNSVSVIVNISILTQILINVFEISKYFSKRNGMIILRINFLSELNENQIESFEKRKNTQKQEHKDIIQFSWSYQKRQETKDQTDNNNQITTSIQLTETVTNYLLKRIGPCNKVFERNTSFDTYVRKIFYIYARQNEYEPGFGQ